MNIDLTKEYVLRFRQIEGGLSIDITEKKESPELPIGIDLIIHKVEGTQVHFDVSANTSKNFVLLVDNEPTKFIPWEDAFVVDLKEDGTYYLRIKDGNLLSNIETVEIKTEIPFCKEGPMFTTKPTYKDGVITFQFHGVEVWEMGYFVDDKKGNVIHEGKVQPTSSWVDITLPEKLKDGVYDLTIYGLSCKSVADVSEFEVKSGGGGGEPSKEFITVDVVGLGGSLPKYNRLSFDGTNMRNATVEPLTGKILDGFHLTPFSGNAVPDETGMLVFQQWEQEFYHSKGGKNNIVEKDGMTYFFRPEGYESEVDNPHYDFYKKFPKFGLPKGKMVILEGGVGKRDKYPSRFNGDDYSPWYYDTNAHLAMLDRGVSHVKGLEKIRPQNSMKFGGDVWMIDIPNGGGYPSDGTRPMPDHEQRVYEWTQRVSPSAILEYWVMVHNTDKNGTEYLGNTAFYMWNFELSWYWPIANPSHFKAFIDLLMEYRDKNLPMLEICVWRKSAYKLRNFSADYDFYDDFVNISKLQTPSELKAYMEKSPMQFSFHEAFFNSRLVQHIGFYQSYLASKENPFNIIFHYLVNKKASPLAKLLALAWRDMEPSKGSDIRGGLKRIVINGFERIVNVKPRVGHSTMNSLGVWATFFLDGLDEWEIVPFDPNTFDEWKIDERPKFPDNVLPNNACYMPIKNIDSLMFGVWQISANKDIVEVDGLPTIVRTNASKIFSNDVRQEPVIAYKLSADKKEALIVVDDFSCVNIDLDENGEVILNKHKVTIGNKDFWIETFYRYPSVVRVKL